MIEVIRQKFKEDMSLNEKLNLTREFLQILCLKTLSEKRCFDHLAFIGGTALRILFDLRRFSEDLDFSIHLKNGFDLDRMSRDLQRSFQLNGLPFEAKIKPAGNVRSINMKFTGLLSELGIAAAPEQKLSIKLEIDLNPPEGWHLLHTLVNKTYLFGVTHYDLPSLYAGKLHACFFRGFTKGRDFYDFLWYLGKKIKPNFVLLNHAIRQTHKESLSIDEAHFKDFLIQHLEKIDFVAVRNDVERFLEDKNELQLLDLRTIRDTLDRIY